MERIASSSRYMALSAKDYLNVSRIEAGHMKYELPDQAEVHAFAGQHEICFHAMCEDSKQIFWELLNSEFILTLNFFLFVLMYFAGPLAKGDYERSFS